VRSKPASAATLLLLALGAVIAAPRDASAYACGRPNILLLAADEPIPPDSIIRLRFPGPETEVLRLGQSRTILEEGVLVVDRAVLVLRGPDGDAVPMRRRILEGTDLPTFELVPSRPLAENTAYRIFAKLHGRDFDVGSFETGATTPRETLSLPTHVRARVVVLPRAEYKGTSGPWIEVRWDPLDHPAPLYEVHVIGDDGAIGPGTLRAIVPGGAKGITFGKTDLCYPAVFNVPKEGPLKLALRGIDLAGRPGPTIPITLDASHPSPRGFAD